MTDPTLTRQGCRYWAWALGSVVLGLAGYVGYVLYPRFDLPAGAGAGLLVLATAAGVASFFSPCSFPLLVTMLARPLASAGDAGSRPLRRALGYASALSVGAAGFLTLTRPLLAAEEPGIVTPPIAPESRSAWAPPIAGSRARIRE